MSTFYVPAVNLIGKGVVKEVGPYVKELGYSKALLVTDKFIEGSDILPQILAPLDAEGIQYVVFSDVEPNPTCKNVMDGVAALKEHNCDFIISVGDRKREVHRKMRLAVFQLLRQMVANHKTMKACTSLLRKVCRWWLSILQRELQLKLPLTMSSQMKNARLRWLWWTRIAWL